MVVAVVAAAHCFSVLGTGGPFERETGSAWAPHFLFVEFVPGESEREAERGGLVEPN